MQTRLDKRTQRRATRRGEPVRVGFMPLIDAAPLIVASELGYFDDEGLRVSLEKQIGWGNVRDRLTYGELHASHAPIGMVPASAASLAHYHEPLILLAALGAGGNAITIAPALAALGDDAAAPARWRGRLGRAPMLAHVFSVSSHRFLLRRMLASAGVVPEPAASLCILPPVAVAGFLEQGTIDGYCVGEPWNTLAMIRGTGAIFRATTELVPDHPEKGVVVTRRWLSDHDDVAERLVRATVRGCDFCDRRANRSRIAELLADPRYLAVDEGVIERSLSIDEWLRPGVRRPPFRTFARPFTAPRASAVEWIAGEMNRHGPLPAATDVARIAREGIADDLYARAVAALDRDELTASLLTSSPEGVLV